VSIDSRLQRTLQLTRAYAARLGVQAGHVPGPVSSQFLH